MNPLVIYASCLVTMAIMLWIVNHYSNLLRDVSSLNKKRPYSYSRVQLAWWTLIILASALATLIVTGAIAVPNESTLILLGVSAGTIAVARTIEVTDRSNLEDNAVMIQNLPGKNLLVDILSDANGISVHRFQAVLFNLMFGAWFVLQFATGLSSPEVKIEEIFPVIAANNLILLGLSSAAYTAVKANENT
jgi:hypothetical protein